MSDDGTTASSMPHAARGSGSTLHGATGEPRPPGARPEAGQADQLADFVQQQPFTAALIALVIGYLLGKVT